MPRSLHNRWLETVELHRDSIAVTEAASGRTFTFSDLERSNATPTLFPSGTGVEFIEQTLASWRADIATCPIEPSTSPEIDLSDLPEGIAHIKTTSGSTGTPRLVLFTADQIAADAQNIVTTMGLSPTSPNIGVISMAHSYGYSNLVLPLLLHGIPLILGGDPLPGSFTRALSFLPESGGTVPAVPAMWRAWLRAKCLDAAKIKTAISAGAPLTTDLETAIYDETSIKVHNFYGSSECGGIAYDRTETPRENPATVGTAMVGVTAALSSDGCLKVSGGAVGSSYWPEKNPNTLSDQEFLTQDLAEITPEGSINLLGRAGDLINIAGRKLDPTSIEAELLKHPAVDHCTVFGVASNDPERVQEIVAITSGGDEEELRGLLSQRLPTWQRVRHWWINPQLRPTERGKISRSAWRRRWESEVPRP